MSSSYSIPFMVKGHKSYFDITPTTTAKDVYDHFFKTLGYPVRWVFAGRNIDHNVLDVWGLNLQGEENGGVITTDHSFVPLPVDLLRINPRGSETFMMPTIVYAGRCRQMAVSINSIILLLTGQPSLRVSSF